MSPTHPLLQVSKWTRLCEIDIPSAVEAHLKTPSSLQKQPPPSILTLEHRLGEPVKVHNDDKIRRQKLKEQRRSEKSPDSEGSPLELRAALSKLSVDSVPSAATRENSEIRKVKTTELPPLEHVFAEGLYFTLTDVVLLPCIYLYLVRAHLILLPPHDLMLKDLVNRFCPFTVMRSTFVHFWVWYLVQGHLSNDQKVFWHLPLLPEHLQCFVFCHDRDLN